jgi:phage repressor protein C with HTH and peptisase S24 domain
MDLENGRSKGTTKLPNIIRVLRTNQRYLETGKGDADQVEYEDSEWANVLGYAQAVGLGDGPDAQEYAETHKLKFRSASLARKRLAPHNLGVMYGKGESMLPRIRPGDAILFDTSDTRPADEALFLVLVQGLAGDGYSVKRCRVIGDWVLFDALNPEGDHTWRKPRRMDDPAHPITIIGRVRWIGSWED